MKLDARAIVADLAGQLGYSPNEIEAGINFADRKSRRAHPPGRWDDAGRFYAKERTTSVRTCRAPSRRRPYSQMKAARTAAHCAEIAEASSVTYVRRIALAVDRSIEGASAADLRKLLTPGVQKRRANRSSTDLQGAGDTNTASN